MNGMAVRIDMPTTRRHPELVSGAISPRARTMRVDRWILKQVQDDGFVGLGVILLALAFSRSKGHPRPLHEVVEGRRKW
jgi:hypothetical protein